MLLFPCWETALVTPAFPPPLVEREDMESSVNGTNVGISWYYLLVAGRARPKNQNIHRIAIWWKQHWNHFVRLFLSSRAGNSQRKAGIYLLLEETKFCLLTCWGRFIIGVKAELWINLSAGLWHQKLPIVSLSPGHPLVENHLFYSKEPLYSVSIKKLLFFFLVATFPPGSSWLNTWVQRSLHRAGVWGEGIRGGSEQPLPPSPCISTLEALPWHWEKRGALPKGRKCDFKWYF